MKRKLLILASTLLVLAIPAIASDAIYQSHAWVASSNQTQQFSENIVLKPEQIRMPLSIMFNNGGVNAPGFVNYKIYINNREVMNEQGFHNKQSAVIDLTSFITSYSIPISFVGTGRPGSTFSFRIVPRQSLVTLNSANPEKVAPEATLTLHGSDFDSTPSRNTVIFGSTSIQPFAASPTSLQIKVPKDAKGGKTTVKVATHGSVSRSITVTVQAKPEVAGVNLFSGPPGSELVITGKNFSEVPSENTVYFGTFTARATQASSTSLTTVIPEGLDAHQPEWYVPVNVETNGMKSESNITVNIQNRYIIEGDTSPVGPRN